MAVNYVGSISILDRGDAPAQAVIDRNARSLAQRVADETREELEKVMTRVENIYGSFEMTSDIYGNDSSSLEYVNDIAELEELIKDQVKKKKYQQQVTVFIVGYQDVCGQKLRLIQQVNEFFMENSKAYEEEDWFPKTPDIDLDDVASKVENSLSTAHDLSNRLGEINKEIIDYLASYAEKKATNKGKKKLERALQQAKDDVGGLSEKLLGVQTELEEKDEKMQALFKQLEMKNLELQRFKTAAEVAKKNVQDSESLQAEIMLRDKKIQELRQQINRLEIEVTSSVHNQEQSQNRLAHTSEENQHRIIQLTKEVEENKMAIDEARRDIQKVHDSQIQALQETHKTEIEELKKQHAEEVKKLMEELECTKEQLAVAEQKNAQLQFEQAGVSDTASDVTRHFDFDSEPSRESFRQESRPSTKDKSSRSQSKQSGRSVAGTGKSTKRQSKVGESKPGSRSSLKPGDSDLSSDEFDEENIDFNFNDTQDAKDFADTAVQDEGGDPTHATVDEYKKGTSPSNRQNRRSKSQLETVQEGDVVDYEDAFDLSNDAAWAGVPGDQLPGRFAQYRKLSQKRMQELKEQLQLTTFKTQRKVQTLKAQFQEHKSKWEAERKVLIEQVSQAHKLKTDAEKEADEAMTQLEDFINEQEKIEEDEEKQRMEVMGHAAVPVETVTSARASPRQSTPGAQQMSTNEVVASETSEPDLQRLMQQTDDAKVQELNSRITTSGAMSAPPAVEAGETTENEEPLTPRTPHPELSVGDPNEPALPERVTPSRENPSPPQPPPSEATNASDAKDALATPISTVRSGEGSIRSANSAKSVKSTKSAVSVRSQKSESVIPDVKQSELENAEAEKSRSESADFNQGGSRASSLRAPQSALSVESQQKSLADSVQSAQSGKRSTLDVKTPSEGMKIDGPSEEVIRAVSARSRASLRSQYRMKLEDTRNAVDERRTKSPAISLPSARSLVDDVLDSEDDDDMPLPDDVKEEMDKKNRGNATFSKGTSPPPGLQKESSGISITQARQSPFLADHPVVKDFIRTYDGVVHFKDAISKILLDKDMMSASQILADLETLRFDPHSKVQPQVDEMTQNIYYMLEEIATLINSIIVYDREPPVSSLMGVSREQTKGIPTQERSSESGRGLLATRGSHQSGLSFLSDQKTLSSDNKASIRELQEQYERLHQQFEDANRKHEEQLRHNTVVMMEMQDTINELQRELSALGKTSQGPPSGTPSHAQRPQKPPSPETSVMFTRLDSERNAKIMKKAVMEERLDPEKYKDAVVQMEKYVSLPAQRLAHLVRKYVHHCRMKAIEDRVKKSKSLNENVFEVLDKMEALQNQRAKKWADHMDEMGVERLHLANILMETLDLIEEDSGLFLIKPMYSFRGRDVKEKYGGKLSRPSRQRPISPIREPSMGYPLVPTPASNFRPYRSDRLSAHQTRPDQSVFRPDPIRPLEGDESGVAGSSVTWVGSSPMQTWSLQASHSKNVRDDSTNVFNTPRILELDINRMLIGQNNISSRLHHPLTDDRLVNASQNNLRSYITVNRPIAHPSASSPNRSRSATGVKDSSAPPSTPQAIPSSAGSKKACVSEADLEIPKTLQHPRSSPLPPITPTGQRSPSEPPQSPPGSSLRQSPPMKELDPEAADKVQTRTSSQMTSTSASEDD